MWKRRGFQSFDGFFVKFLGPSWIVVVQRPTDVVEKSMGLDGVVEERLYFVRLEVEGSGLGHLIGLLKLLSLGSQSGSGGSLKGRERGGFGFGFGFGSGLFARDGGEREEKEEEEEHWWAVARSSWYQ